MAAGGGTAPVAPDSESRRSQNRARDAVRETRSIDNEMSVRASSSCPPPSPAMAETVFLSRALLTALNGKPVKTDASDRGSLIAVVLGLVGAGVGQVEVVGLRGAERGQLDAELVEVERRDFLVEVPGQYIDLVSYLPWLVHSSIWASTWLVKDALITKLGWPVAQPRLTSLPLASTISRLPSGRRPRRLAA
jgi:hypothetical protein